MSERQPGEFELIARLLRRLPADEAAGVVGAGDDCAAVADAEGFQLLTCDIAIAGRHFLPGVTPMADVGWRAATANVSDVVACGGLPRWALVSLGLPRDFEPAALDALYDGLAEGARDYGFRVLGGNVSGASELMLDVFMLGHTPRFIGRGGAQPGDLIAVSGTLGESEAGRRVLAAAGTPQRVAGEAEAALVRRHLRPRARVDLVPLLREVATSAIDVSDGLAPELGHLAERSGACMAVEADRLPISAALRTWAQAQGADATRLALHSGEAYEVLFTLPPAEAERLAGTDVSVIGEVRPGGGVLVDGAAPPPGGWDHLRAGGTG